MQISCTFYIPLDNAVSSIIQNDFVVIYKQCPQMLTNVTKEELCFANLTSGGNIILT